MGEDVPQIRVPTVVVQPSKEKDAHEVKVMLVYLYIYVATKQSQ